MSIQTANIKTITWLPLSSILRPIPPTIDEPKVQSMIQTLQTTPADPTPAPSSNDETSPTPLPPVDILHYQRPADGDEQPRDFYFAFGGCHRLRAYQGAEVPMVACRVLKVSKKMLKVYLGSSVDRIVGD